MAGIPALIQALAAANALPKVPYKGTGGMGAIFSMLAELELERGVMQVADLNALALISGGDAKLVVVPDYGLFHFNPALPVLLPSANVPAQNGGMWELLIRGGAEYRKLIGDATSLSFAIAHMKGTPFPTVDVWDTSNTPYVRRAEGVDYHTSVVDQDNITITTIGTSPWGGNSQTVVVKP